MRILVNEREYDHFRIGTHTVYKPTDYGPIIIDFTSRGERYPFEGRDDELNFDILNGQTVMREAFFFTNPRIFNSFIRSPAIIVFPAPGSSARRNQSDELISISSRVFSTSLSSSSLESTSITLAIGTSIFSDILEIEYPFL